MKCICIWLAGVALVLALVTGIGGWIVVSHSSTVIDGTVEVPKSDAEKETQQQELALAKALGEEPSPSQEFGKLRGGAEHRSLIVGSNESKIQETTANGTTYRYYLAEDEEDQPFQVKTAAYMARGAIAGLVFGAGLLLLLASFFKKQEEPEVELASA